MCSYLNRFLKKIFLFDIFVNYIKSLKLRFDLYTLHVLGTPSRNDYIYLCQRQNRVDPLCCTCCARGGTTCMSSRRLPGRGWWGSPWPWPWPGPATPAAQPPGSPAASRWTCHPLQIINNHFPFSLTFKDHIMGIVMLIFIQSPNSVLSSKLRLERWIGS